MDLGMGLLGMGIRVSLGWVFFGEHEDGQGSYVGYS